MSKKSKKFPITTRNTIIGGIFVITAAFITISPHCFDSSNDENEKNNNSVANSIQDSTRNYEDGLCNAIENSLSKWIGGFDIRFKKSYDSLRHQLAVRVGLESGLAVSVQLDFCIDKRLKKDAKIDSFIIEYTKHSCDVNKLIIKRKLPIEVRNITKRRNKDYGPHYKGVILDTL